MPLKNSSGRNWGTLRLNLAALFFTTLAGLAVYGYYSLSPSYNAAREAKKLYEQGDYEAALKLAKSIQIDHPYNIMAFSVEEQSLKAIRWKKFIDMSAGYWKRIDEISRQKTLEPADLATVRLMIEAVIYDYAKLGSPGILMDERLIKEADYYHGEFTALYKELFGKSYPPVSGVSGQKPGPQR